MEQNPPQSPIPISTGKWSSEQASLLDIDIDLADVMPLAKVIDHVRSLPS